MRVLVDTHAFVWWLTNNRRLSAGALDVLEEGTNQVIVSAVVAWEIAIKTRVGKWPEAEAIVRDIGDIVAKNQFQPLSISITHAHAAGYLPGAHRDPFDRMLAAQAAIERVPLVTADPAFRTFGTETLW